ncbi:hypothetical protein BDZ90DRAFT_233486 [Jaminaea rosea]|uniref:Uncharacterized protein n=1 Tax=Jaminaea rosea TaxID=1569628 RepID=A0A316UNK2_9BASI|nr:hypothetical protein BDZ90DRAFT_233486 [Jaminaea rosea]PWN26358.1 hypothetical protein BDZ90DRAFT_233486 [Jaminaea rosea]
MATPSPRMPSQGPARLTGAFSSARMQARGGWRKASGGQRGRRSVSVVRFAEEAASNTPEEAAEQMPPPTKIPRRSQISFVPPTPTLEERCHALATNALAVLAFYARLVDEDNFTSAQTLSEMRRNWEPFDSYKTNQLLENAQYHHHFIDADEVARSLLSDHHHDEGLPLGFRETMLIANCATFLHYIWSLPSSPSSSSTPTTWPCRNVAEMQDAWRVFLRHIVPYDRPLSDDVLEHHLELSTQVYIARLTQLHSDRHASRDELEDEADGELDELLGPSSLDSVLAARRQQSKRKLQAHWIELTDKRAIIVDGIAYDAKALRTAFPLAQMALDITPFILDIVSQVEEQVAGYQEPHLLGRLFANHPSNPLSPPPPPAPLGRVLPPGAAQPVDSQAFASQREAWLRELMDSQSQASRGGGEDGSIVMSGISGWGAASQAGSASDFLEAQDRMDIYQELVANERGIPQARQRRSQSRQLGPTILRRGSRAPSSGADYASDFSVSTSVALRAMREESQQSQFSRERSIFGYDLSGRSSSSSRSGSEPPLPIPIRRKALRELQEEAVSEGSPSSSSRQRSDSEPALSTPVRQEALRELQAVNAPSSRLRRHRELSISTPVRREALRELEGEADGRPASPPRDSPRRSSESDTPVPIPVRRAALHELEADVPPSSPPSGPFAAAIQQRRASGSGGTVARSPTATGIQVRQGRLVRGPATAGPSRFNDRSAAGEREMRFDSQEDEEMSEDIFLEQQRQRQRRQQRDRGGSTYRKRGRRGARGERLEERVDEGEPEAEAEEEMIEWPEPPRKPLPFSVIVPRMDMPGGPVPLSLPIDAEGQPAEAALQLEDAPAQPHIQTTTTPHATVVTATTISDADRIRLEEWRAATSQGGEADAGGFEEDDNPVLIAARNQLTLEYWFARVRPGLENLPTPRPQANFQAAVAEAIRIRKSGKNPAREAVLRPHLVGIAIEDGQEGEGDERQGEGDEQDEQGDEGEAEAEPIEVEDNSRDDEERVAAQLSASQWRAKQESDASSDEDQSSDQLDAGNEDEDADFRPNRTRRAGASQQQRSRSHASASAPAASQQSLPTSSQRRNKDPWTSNEISTLLTSLYALARFKEVDPHYQVYAQVLSRHGRTGSESQVLAKRNNTDLKAQARVELWRMRDAGETIPYWKRLLMPRVFLEGRPRATAMTATQEAQEAEQQGEEREEQIEAATGEGGEGAEPYDLGDGMDLAAGLPPQEADTPGSVEEAVLGGDPSRGEGEEDHEMHQESADDTEERVAMAVAVAAAWREGVPNPSEGSDSPLSSVPPLEEEMRELAVIDEEDEGKQQQRGQQPLRRSRRERRAPYSDTEWEHGASPSRKGSAAIRAGPHTRHSASSPTRKTTDRIVQPQVSLSSPSRAGQPSGRAPELRRGRSRKSTAP